MCPRRPTVGVSLLGRRARCDLCCGHLGAMAWLLLTIPVLVAGLVRLRRSDWRLLGRCVACGPCTCFPVADWQPSAPTVMRYASSRVRPHRVPICRRELGRAGGLCRVAGPGSGDDPDTGQAGPSAGDLPMPAAVPARKPAAPKGRPPRSRHRGRLWECRVFRRSGLVAMMVPRSARMSKCTRWTQASAKSWCRSPRRAATSALV